MGPTPPLRLLASCWGMGDHKMEMKKYMPLEVDSKEGSGPDQEMKVELRKRSCRMERWK